MIASPSYPAEIASTVPILGPMSTMDVLLRGGVIQPGEAVRGLPGAPHGGLETTRDRIKTAMQDALARFPVDQILVSTEMLLVDAAQCLSSAPLCVMIPTDATSDVEEHYRRVGRGVMDVERVPQLPRPRGALPMLFLCGSYGPTTSYLRPEDKHLLDLFMARSLGVAIVIDPTDVGTSPVTGWTAVYTPVLHGSYFPALFEASIQKDTR